MTKDELSALGRQGAGAILERRNEKPSDFQIAYSLAAGALALAEDLTVPEMLAEEVFKSALEKHSVSEATFKAAVTDARKQLRAAKREAEEQAAQAALPKMRRRRKAAVGATPAATSPHGASVAKRNTAAGKPFSQDRISNHSTEGM